jgi:hypothetical protein
MSNPVTLEKADCVSSTPISATRSNARTGRSCSSIRKA